ncbi:MAG TPA: FG-GAP-like repeat-containing protein [Bacteroidia bacterium]|nr:FG-GAP-like repeat-containing protein [Bacteroidia bacterium]
MMKIFLKYLFIFFFTQPIISMGQLCLGPVTSYSNCNLPVSFEIVDINKDGVKDIAMAGANLNGAILLGSGTGSFGVCNTFSTLGWYPLGITVGDFNNDSNQDLAVSSNSLIEIFIGNGTGIYSIPSNTITFSPSKIVSVDVNSDLNLDLIVGCSGADSVAVFLGNGTGSFSSFNTYSLTSSVNDLQIIDFNNDGKVDLATSNYWSKEVSIILGNGTGSFGPCSTFSLTTYIRCLAISDLNNDGKKDIIAAGDGSSFIFFGNTTGNLSTPSTFTTPSTPYDITSGNFDFDGNNDIAIPDYSGSIKVLLGTGTGNFAGVNSYAITVGNPWSISSGDINGDSKIDLVGGCDNTFQNLFVLLNCNTIGIEEKVNSDIFTLYPNPNTGILYFSLENIDLIMSQVIISNCLGQKVFESEYKTELNISSLPNGIYILKLENSQGQIAAKRLVVSK